MSAVAKDEQRIVGYQLERADYVSVTRWGHEYREKEPEKEWEGW